MKLAGNLLICSLVTACMSPTSYAAASDGIVRQDVSPTVAEPAPQLSGGVTPNQVSEVIRRLQDLQQKLRRGEATYFDLLSGANASSEEATQSPRQAFLGMAFEKPFSVERAPTDNKLWQPIRLTYPIEAERRWIWEVEVVLGINGQVERVQMLKRPPAPF